MGGSGAFFFFSNVCSSVCVLTLSDAVMAFYFLIFLADVILYSKAEMFLRRATKSGKGGAASRLSRRRLRLLGAQQGVSNLANVAAVYLIISANVTFRSIISGTYSPSSKPPHPRVSLGLGAPVGK